MFDFAIILLDFAAVGFVVNEMISVPAHSRGGLVTFVATKVTKNAVSANGFFSHDAFAPRSGKTTGRKLLPHYSFAQRQRFSKTLNALAALVATIVLPNPARSLNR